LSEDARALLGRTPLIARRGPFALGAWPVARASAVASGMLRSRGVIWWLIVDETEVTALVAESALSELPPSRQCERGWAVITLDLAMDWDVTGVIAAVSDALARAGIPLGAVAAYSRDHLLVPAMRLEQALDVLSEICADVRVLD
jgi:hypothetical protein